MDLHHADKAPSRSALIPAKAGIQREMLGLQKMAQKHEVAELYATGSPLSRYCMQTFHLRRSMGFTPFSPCGRVPEGGMRGRFRPLPGFQNGNCGRSNLRTCFFSRRGPLIRPSATFSRKGRRGLSRVFADQTKMSAYCSAFAGMTISYFTAYARGLGSGRRPDGVQRATAKAELSSSAPFASSPAECHRPAPHPAFGHLHHQVGKEMTPRLT